MGTNPNRPPPAAPPTAGSDPAPTPTPAPTPEPNSDPPPESENHDYAEKAEAICFEGRCIQKSGRRKQCMETYDDCDRKGGANCASKALEKCL